MIQASKQCYSILQEALLALHTKILKSTSALASAFQVEMKGNLDAELFDHLNFGRK